MNLAGTTLYPDAPTDTGYAYAEPGRGRMVPCTEQRLRELCASRNVPPRVQTPDTQGAVPPWEVPALLGAIRTRVLKWGTPWAVFLATSVWMVDFVRDRSPLAALAISLVAAAVLWVGRRPPYPRLTRDEAAALRRALAPEPFRITGDRPGWRDLLPPRPRLATSDYGMVRPDSGVVVATTREELISEVRAGRIPIQVWTPETQEMVPVWEVPFLVDETVALPPRTGARGREFHWMLAVAGAITLVCLVIHWVFGLFAAVLLGGWLGVAHAGWSRRARPLTPRALRDRLDALAEVKYRQTLPIPGTMAIGWALVATGVLQLVLMEPSVQAGGLNPADVARGEWWRLFTAPMLHGSAFSWVVNGAALLLVGRELETRTPHGWLPFAFLASALAGGAGSLLLPPSTTFVGASGGLMGLLGFLLAMSHRRRAEFVPGYPRNLAAGVAIVLALGVLIADYLDNGAHVGGLIAGALLGWVAVPSSARVPRWTGGRTLEWAGRAALWIIRAGAAAAIALTLWPLLRR